MVQEKIFLRTLYTRCFLKINEFLYTKVQNLKEIIL